MEVVNRLDAEDAAGEILSQFVGGEEVGVFLQFLNLKLLRYGIEDASLHHSGVGFVEVGADFGGDG